ncbi:MAG TPA: diguanylate cyclase [Acidimicrobiales bacterium]
MQGPTSRQIKIPPAASGLRPVDPSARAAVAALVRALEVHDPALAHRAALRAALVQHTAGSLGLDPEEWSAALGGALLADIAALVVHARPDPERDPSAAVLGADLAERAGAGWRVARAVRHRFERWDGGGTPQGLAGDAIPLEARLVALVHVLVGPVEAGGIPHWTARAGRARSLAGTTLDPGLVAVVTERLAADPIPEALQSLDGALRALDTLVHEPDHSSPIEALTSIGAAIHAADRIDDVLALIAEHARRALRAQIVSIGRIDHADQTLEVLVNVGELGPGEERFPVNQSVPLSELPPFTAFRTGEAHALSRTDAPDEGSEASYLVARRVQSELAVPITIDGEPWGVVTAGTRPGRRELDEHDLGTLRLVAAQISAGVAQATRVADLETLALRDPLTGLGNRRVLEAKLRQIFRRPPVARQDVAVIICDVDDLKKINDAHGHAIGDAVLLEAADALRLAVTGVADSTVCRIGGDEFCVIIDGGGQLLAEPIAERAQKLFSRTNDRSMSCGVAVATIDMNTPADLLRAADEAQYEQKRKRRGITAVEAEAVRAEHARRRARRDLL